MSLSSQLAEAVDTSNLSEEAAEGSGFYTTKSWQQAVSKLPARLADASGSPWDAMKAEGPKKHAISGGEETYVSQKWYPKDRKMQMVAELIVTLSGGKLHGVFSIEKKGKSVFSEKKDAANLAALNTWIDTLVQPE